MNHNAPSLAPHKHSGIAILGQLSDIPDVVRDFGSQRECLALKSTIRNSDLRVSIRGQGAAQIEHVGSSICSRFEAAPFGCMQFSNP